MQLKPAGLYLGVFTTLAAQVFISPAAFLNAAPGVNYGIHGLSFIFGLLSTYFYAFVQRHGSTGGGRPSAGAATYALQPEIHLSDGAAKTPGLAAYSSPTSGLGNRAP